MPLIARQRSRLAVLAVLALVGSLLAVSAVPAVAAEDDTADEKAMYSACVGAAEDDAGFADMRGNFAEDEANCLAHYGITLGTGTDEDGNSLYGPSSSVTRWQMALFLSRAAGPAGIELPMASDQMLSDIGSLGDNAQDAINQMADLGIMAARSSGMFDPDGVVTRQDMAVHLAGFLSNALTGPGGVDIDDLKNGRASGKSPFTDIEGVTVAAHKSIRDIFELGVAAGTSATEFSPDAPVRRDQMAAFIARALAHTNARPAGITAQGPAMAFVDAAAGAGGDADISVSVRDSMDHSPVPDASIGVISTETPDEAFDDAGECVTAKVTSSGAGCKITTSDEATDPDGNADINVDLGNTAGTTTVWVWTGDTGDAFDADTTERATVEIDRTLEATGLKVTVDTKENAKFLKFGDTITYTFQAVDANGDAVAHKDASVNVTATIEDITPSIAADGTRNADELHRDDSETTEATHKTGADGSFEISFTADDPESGNDKRGDRIELSIVLADASLTLNVTAANDQNTTDDGIQIIWSDAASDASGGTLSLSSPVRYHEVDSAGGPVGNALMATLVDQYGDPVRGQKVSVWSTVTNTATDNLGLGGRVLGTAGGDDNPADNRTTNRNGVATKRYTRSGTVGVNEVLDASLKMVNGECRNTDAGCDSGDDADTDIIAATDVTDLTHYWAVRATASVSAQTVLVADQDNNSIVLGPEATPTLVTYKSGDYFQIADASATMEAFEKALNDATGGATADSVTVTINTASGINTFNISTNN